MGTVLPAILVINLESFQPMFCEEAANCFPDCSVCTSPSLFCTVSCELRDCPAALSLSASRVWILAIPLRESAVFSSFARDVCVSGSFTLAVVAVNSLISLAFWAFAASSWVRRVRSCVSTLGSLSRRASCSDLCCWGGPACSAAWLHSLVAS